VVSVSVDLSVLSWIWHDAEILSLNSNWSPKGVLSIGLKCEINPYENRQALINLGITTLIVDTTFYDCSSFSFESSGNYSNRESIDRWLCKQSSANKSTFHTITCSGGSKLSLVCGEVTLSSVD